uniref:transposase domain-containing protein n=1 Tax=Frankia sp. Cr1 TaxID=3073931 RepID=UPI002AD21748
MLGLLADRDTIAGVLDRCGHVDPRRRVLTGAVTVLAVLGLCLFRRENDDLVLARVVAVAPGVVEPGDGPPMPSLPSLAERASVCLRQRQSAGVQ